MELFKSNVVKVLLVGLLFLFEVKFVGDIWEQALVLKENYPQMCKDNATGAWREEE